MVQNILEAIHDNQSENYTAVSISAHGSGGLASVDVTTAAEQIAPGKWSPYQQTGATIADPASILN